MRIEKDFIGEEKIPQEALYGIHALRAQRNFPDETPFPKEWYQAMGSVKQACYQTCLKFNRAVEKKFPAKKPVVLLDDHILGSLIGAAQRMAQGDYFNDFIVPAITGGAGTSINMNVNEILSNVVLQNLGHRPGQYQIVDPIEHANVFQSTNDTVPTALKVALLQLLETLENEINVLRSHIERLENSYRDALRTGYTQMQEAVPSSYGKLFSAYNDALSRDWWRVSKCFERIKVVNLGGGATGTGMGVPRFYIMEVAQELHRLTGLPVTRGENLVDTTSNLDVYVEVHAIMKALAVNLEKMTGDMRLLGSDIRNTSEVLLPACQVGSSIMPGKVNPVIPEFVISAAHKIYANDGLITALAAQGCLELNAYLPTIGCALIESLKLLIAACRTTGSNLFENMVVNSAVSAEQLMMSPAVTTALSPYIGYNKASELARMMKSEKIDVLKANRVLKVMGEEKLKKILTADGLLKQGYSLNDLMNEEK